MYTTVHSILPMMIAHSCSRGLLPKFLHCPAERTQELNRTGVTGCSPSRPRPAALCYGTDQQERTMGKKKASVKLDGDPGMGGADTTAVRALDGLQDCRMVRSMRQFTEFYVYVTVHRDKFLFNKTNRRTHFSKFIFVKKLSKHVEFLDKNKLRKICASIGFIKKKAVHRLYHGVLCLEKCQTVSRHTSECNVVYVIREVQPFPTSIDTEITTAQHTFVDSRTEFYTNRMNIVTDINTYHCNLLS
jgi:hypothetical protein